jgi:hypothetical protein
MKSQMGMKVNKTIINKRFNKIEYIYISILIVLLAGAVYFSSGGTGAKVPTGYASLTGLTLEETKNNANFDIPLVTELPFNVTKEEGTISITKYGSEEVHRVNLLYLNEQTAQELYVVVSKLDKDLQEYDTLATETVQLPNGKNAKYGIIGYGEGLTWKHNGTFYGIYNHLNNNQPKLGVDKLMEMAERF